MGIGAFFKALVEFKVIAGGWQKVVSLTKGNLLLRGPGMNRWTNRLKHFLPFDAKSPAKGLFVCRHSPSLAR